MKRIFNYFIIYFFSRYAFAHTTLETVGDVGQIALPLAAIGMTFIEKDKIGLKEFGFSYLLSTGSVQLLKHTIYRERPNHHSQSFPSGHTANGFVSAGFLQQRYGWAYGAPAYAFAAVTGYSRIEAKKHWTTDVLAGAVIGFGASYIFTTKYTKSIEIIPYINTANAETGVAISANLT